MGRRGLNRAVVTVGALLFCISVAANLIRIAHGGSITATLKLYVVHQPVLLVELLLTVFLVSLLVKGGVTTRTVTILAGIGVLVTFLSVSGLYSYWEFSEASAFPVARDVWLLLVLELLGGILLVAGTLRELRDSSAGGAPEMT